MNIKLNKNIDFSGLPDDLSISTITITCKIDTLFNVTNIGKYIDLSYNGIIDVQQGSASDKTTNRSLIVKKQSLQPDKTKTKKKAFYNQVSLHVKTGKNKSNIKLFKNGSIQVTGCKNTEHLINALNKVFAALKTVKAIYDPKTNKIVDKPFTSNIDILDIKFLYGVKICMINSNFSIGFNVDRDKLFELLTNEDIECSYDPIIHACVDIKYEHVEKTISIFVFESGSIIITGAQTCPQIVEAYNFINKFLLNNYNYVNKNNKLTNSTIMDFLNSST